MVENKLRVTVTRLLCNDVAYDNHGVGLYNYFKYEGVACST